jgi:hypothetical protein
MNKILIDRRSGGRPISRVATLRPALADIKKKGVVFPVKETYTMPLNVPRSNADSREGIYQLSNQESHGVGGIVLKTGPRWGNARAAGDRVHRSSVGTQARARGCGWVELSDCLFRARVTCVSRGPSTRPPGRYGHRGHPLAPRRLARPRSPLVARPRRRIGHSRRPCPVPACER